MQTNTASPEMLLLVSRFVGECQEMVNKSYGTLSPPTLLVEQGKRYIKIVSSQPHTRSIYGFVDIATGDVLKAASWQAPAKHVRGNVRKHASACAGPYGIVYLR